MVRSLRSINFILTAALLFSACGGTGVSDAARPYFFSNAFNQASEPILELRGDNPLHVSEGFQFVEPGWYAVSIKDGDISSRVVVSGSVNSNMAGHYVLNYRIRDSLGGETDTNRDVIVDSSTRVSISSPFVGWHTNSLSVLVSGSCADGANVNLSGDLISGVMTTCHSGQFSQAVSLASGDGLKIIRASQTLGTLIRADERQIILDRTAPQISAGTFTLFLCSRSAEYRHSGVTAYDPFYGDLTSRVEVTADTVNPLIASDVYRVDYRVQDLAGNIATASRAVTVSEVIVDQVSFGLGLETGADLSAIGSTAGNLSRRFLLCQDIDLQGASFAPLGDMNSPFTGILNGNSHAIHHGNIVSVANSADPVGLFSFMDGEVHNLVLRNMTLQDSSKNAVAILAGVNRGTIEHVRIENAVVEGQDQVGALVGVNLGSVSRSMSSGSVLGRAEVGGLVGRQTRLNGSAALSENSYSTTTVVGSQKVGGLLGHGVDGDVKNSFSLAVGLGAVAGQELGGLIGKSEHGFGVTRSFWDTDVSGILDESNASQYGTGFDTATLYLLATYSVPSNGAWDFANIWLPPSNSYPELR